SRPGWSRRRNDNDFGAHERTLMGRQSITGDSEVIALGGLFVGRDARPKNLRNEANVGLFNFFSAARLRGRVAHCNRLSTHTARRPSFQQQPALQKICKTKPTENSSTFSIQNVVGAYA